MMTFIPSVNKIQYGVSATAVATIQPPGLDGLDITPKVEVYQLPDLRGDTMPAHESIVRRRWTEFVHSGIFNYDLAYLMLDAMFGAATPAGGVYDYLGSLDWAGLTERQRCFYYGQTGLIYKIASALPKELTITVAKDMEVRFSETLFGAPVVDGASFAVLTDEAVNWALAHHATLFLDAGLDATAGTTEVTDLGFSAEARITCNREPVWHLGNQAPDSYKVGKWGGSMALSFEADATRLALLGDIIDAAAEGEGFVSRLQLTDGSNELLLDFAGVAVEAPKPGADNDGIISFDLNLMPAYGTDLETCWAAQLTLA